MAARPRRPVHRDARRRGQEASSASPWGARRRDRREASARRGRQHHERLHRGRRRHRGPGGLDPGAPDLRGRRRRQGRQHRACSRSGPFDAPADLVTTEVKVKSHDGAMVPLSIIHRKGVKLDGSNPTLLYGYGAATASPKSRASAPSRLAWLDAGGVLRRRQPARQRRLRPGVVPGRLARRPSPTPGRTSSPAPSTWSRRSAPEPAKLGILGGSAGGILVGRAMTERPDLFAAVVPAVGALDMVRVETTRQRRAQHPRVRHASRPRTASARCSR